MTMTPSTLTELERLLAEATPGPWEHGCDEDPPDSTIEYDGCAVAFVHDHANIKTILRTGQDFSHADARLIAAMRNSLPELLRERRELRARVLDEMAVRVALGSGVSAHTVEKWAEAKDCYEHNAYERAAALLHHYARLIREGRR